MGWTDAFRAAGLTGAIALLAACAGPIAIEGPGPSPPALGSAGFVIGAPPEGAGPTSALARAAVEAALVARGFSAAPDGRHRGDVAFAVAPTDVEVAELAIDDAEARVRPTLGLCRRQRYVLSMAMLDRRDGRVVFRNRASAVRCGNTGEELVGALARAVVRGI